MRIAIAVICVAAAVSVAIVAWSRQGRVSSPPKEEEVSMHMHPHSVPDHHLHRSCRNRSLR